MGSLEEPKFYNIINGEKRSSKESYRVTDPRTEESLWDAPVATASDLEDAVAAANKAFKTWGKSTIAERRAVLAKMADVIRENAAELSALTMRETGKSALMGQIEVDNTVGQIAVVSRLALEDEVQYEDDTVRVLATHPPLGVVAAICPWNFPVIMCNFKMISALVTGNCVIVKPSPFTPYAVLRMAELCAPLLPPGVLQAVNGGADVGAQMTAHPGVAKVSFTGTAATGRRVMAACAATLKRVTLELAGNDAALVLPDVDVAAAAVKTAQGAFFNAGQMCVATKRVYVHESIYEEFLGRFVAEVAEKYGVLPDAAAPTVFGPVSNKLQYDTVKKILEDAKKRGAAVVAGGDGAGTPEKGYWIPPTVVADPPEDSLLVQEEQFGPIIPILKWSNEDDVIARANLANAGLGATVYCRDVAKAESIARRLEAGSVYINMPEMPNPNAYFSGFKDSGLGGEMGRQGLLAYCYTQSIHIPKA
ncbi:Aldehyde dehydrogenase [Pleurostoma richardsiae]|uniref:aldehyde dehydrogenase (NAD(+)) n=1 Tax=Pleurostoma richardsiae TaxID=41990 RepID=A0AA38VCU9_9PEZI|nr:Aldehyde dehydrogenase [Pleurostoma richardsiae]